MTQKKGALHRLLRLLHGAVFDTSPNDSPAFRIEHDDGVQWSIADGIMIVVRYGEEYALSLTDHTVASLIIRLRVIGLNVSEITPYFYGKSAAVLMEGQSDVGGTNGGIVRGFRDPLWSIMTAAATELRSARAQVREAIGQLIIGGSSGYWLSLWGKIFGVPLNDRESENGYRQRIPQEVFRFRVNKFAIQKAVRDQTGLDIRLRENWGNMFRLDQSKLSGSYRLVDADAWRYGYVQPYAKQLFDWGDAIEIIERNLAAGVLIYNPISEISTLVDAQIKSDPWFGYQSGFGAYIPQVPSPDRGAAITSLMGLMNRQKTGSWAAGGTWDERSWSYGVRHDELAGVIFARTIATSRWISGRTWRQGGWTRWDGQ